MLPQGSKEASPDVGRMKLRPVPGVMACQKKNKKKKKKKHNTGSRGFKTFQGFTSTRLNRETDL